jgi:hypothetical protein
MQLGWGNRQEIFGGTMNRSRAPVTFNPVPAKAESNIMNAHRG